MYFHVYLIYRFTRTFTDHSSVITRCWGFELQNGKSSLKSPQTLATQDFAPASFLSTPDTETPKPQRFMFTGTQCDLWSRPVGTGHEKSKSREIPSTYFYTLIPSLHEHEASGGGHGRCLYCRLTSFSRSLQTILRINLDGTNNFAHKS